MPKFWQSIEKNARLTKAISVLGSSDVKKARPNGLTAEECYALLLSNNVCTSIPMAKSTLKELHWSGRLKLEGGLYSIPKKNETDLYEDPKEFLDKLAKAKTEAPKDKASIKFGVTLE
jgi:hypothetical protein